jgi:hypothetical protein
MKPHILYAAYRASGTGSIYSWDIRSNTDLPVEIFQSPESGIGKTNQKLRFDIDFRGRMLGVGDQVCTPVMRTEFLSPTMTCFLEQVGNISIFSVGDANAADRQPYLDIGEPNDLIVHSPTLRFQSK